MDEIKDEQETPEFPKLVFIYNLDYKSPRNRGLLDISIDVPLAHAVIEYFRHLILQTPEGRVAAHEVMEKYFPQYWRGGTGRRTTATYRSRALCAKAFIHRKDINRAYYRIEAKGGWIEAGERLVEGYERTRKSRHARIKRWMS